MTRPHENPWLATRARDGDTYDETYERRAAAGENVHGEADFVMRFAPASVLDAGCGTGRVGRELARRGLDVAGVDIDPVMLETARRKEPGIRWELADLATVDLGRTFDLAVAAGNVMIFLTPGSEQAVLSNLALHLRPGGALIAGFQLRPGGLNISRYDELCAAAGLEPQARFSTWDGDVWAEGAGYIVAVHGRPDATGG